MRESLCPYKRHINRDKIFSLSCGRCLCSSLDPVTAFLQQFQSVGLSVYLATSNFLNATSRETDKPNDIIYRLYHTCASYAC